MTAIDPTATGIDLSPTTCEKYADVFAFVREQWLATQNPAAPPTQAMIEAVDNFIEAARQTFGKNMPVALDFMSASLALRFQNGSVLPFCDVNAAGMKGGDQGSLDVSKAHPNRTGKGATTPSASWGVTGEG